MPKAPLVFVGVATHDTIALVDRFPDPDERMVVDELTTAGGGPAATAAVTAARLGADVAFVGTVGDDRLGGQILDELVGEGVDVSGVTIRAGEASGASVVVVAAGAATRAILNRPPPAIELSDAAIASLADASWVHVDQAGWGAVGDWWRASDPRPRLSIDAGNPIDSFSPVGIDLYVPTIAALRRRHGDGEPADLLAAALDEGARCVVATDGAHGSYALTPGSSLVHVPAAAGEVRSTLGAGDVFHGALLAAVHRGTPLADALAYANQVSVLSCAGLDGRSAVPTHDQTLAALADRAG